MQKKKTSLTHVFISYCHKNTHELQTVLARLETADVPYWFDDSIEAGGKWRPQIDTALQEAFAVLVIVTPESMESRYVTYEWSWALGSSIPLFPLLLKGSYDCVHSRLLDEHVVNCIDGIPNHVIESLKSMATMPPAIQYLNSLIRGIIFPLRVSIAVVSWLYHRVDLNSHEQIQFFDDLVHRLVDCAGNIADKELPELLVDKSHAFNSWQKQKCREVLKATRMIPVLGNALHTIAELPQDRREEARKELAILLDKIHEEWLPAVIELDDQTSVAEYLEDYLLPLSLEQDRDLEDELHKEF